MVVSLSFTEKTQLENGQALILIQGVTAKQNNLFAYVKMDNKQINQLNEDINNKIEVDFSLYGRVILSGNGTPTPRIKEYMEEEYNFYHV